MEKIRMVNMKPGHQRFGEVDYFTPATAGSRILEKDGWVAQELKRETPKEIEVTKEVKAPKAKAKRTKK